MKISAHVYAITYHSYEAMTYVLQLSYIDKRGLYFWVHERNHVIQDRMFDIIDNTDFFFAAIIDNEISDIGPTLVFS